MPLSVQALRSIVSGGTGGRLRAGATPRRTAAKAQEERWQSDSGELTDRILPFVRRASVRQRTDGWPFTRWWRRGVPSVRYIEQGKAGIAHALATLAIRKARPEAGCPIGRASRPHAVHAPQLQGSDGLDGGVATCPVVM